MLGTTIGDLFRRTVRYYAGRVAVKQGERAVTYADLGTRVNRLANALAGTALKSRCGLEPAPSGFLGRERSPAPGLDDAGDELEDRGREHGAHLAVAGLVPTDAWDRPQPVEQPRPVRVDGELPVVTPLDSTVATGNHGRAFDVELNAEAMRLRERM